MQLNMFVVDRLFRKSCISFMSSMWNEPQIKNHIKYLLLADQTITIGDIEKHLCDVITRNTCLPEVIKFHLSNFIQPMKRQILYFVDITQYLFKIYADSSVKIDFIWSDKGVLDLSKTAKVIVNSNPCYVLLGFSLACKLCLEDVVYKLQEAAMLDLYANLGVDIRPFMYGICCFWFECRTEGRISRSRIVYKINDMSVEILISFISEINDISVIKFFVDKMNFQKMEIVNGVLFRICRKTRPRHGLILRYLLSHLEFSGIHFSRNNAYKVLSCFLEWPSLDIFLPVLRRLWKYISCAEYLHLTIDIAECIHEYPLTYDYQNLFYQYWEESPVHFKEHIYSKCTSGSFLCRLALFRNVENIFEVVLKDSTPELRQQMVFHFEGMNLCDYLVKKNNLCLLKIFVLNCVPNIEIFQEFLVQYEAYAPSYQDKEMIKRKKLFEEIVRPWYNA